MSEFHNVLEQFDISGRVALLSGGTGWLGTAFSQTLAEAGASVVISSRDRVRAQAAADLLPSPGGAKHYGVELDQIDGDSIAAGFKEAVDAAGQVDILVNNGLHALGADIYSVTMEEFAEHQRNNAGYFILARTLRDHVVERSAAGAVVNIGSMYGQVASYPDAYDPGGASPVAYHALKGGTIHMTRHMAAYWAEDNVRVNCLSPGPFPSDEAPVKIVDRLSQKLPMKRMGRPHELKGALLLLVSDAGSFMTGQNVTVDGGWTAW
jgi:gluconate 5-dehydrogenase